MTKQNHPEHQSIALIGFQSSGKTTLGCKLAESISLPFIDSDREIEKYYPNQTCRDIHCTLGEACFRELERKVIHAIAYDPPLVISTGGGSLLLPENGDHLSKHCTVIYLKISVEILLDRILKRPLLPSYLDPNQQEQSIRKHHHEREILYEKWAKHILQLDGLSVENALKQLERLL